MHEWYAVGAPHHNQTWESEEEGKICTYRDHFSPELPGGNVLTVDFSGKLDYLLLHHYLVSLLPFLIGLFPALLHIDRNRRGVVFLYCWTHSSSATPSSFPRDNGSVLHGPPGVHTTVPARVCHRSRLHSPEQNTTQPRFVLRSGSWTQNKHEAHIKR